jgi:hypothetical protein
MCISGRANHHCHFLQHLLLSDEQDPPLCCTQCAIREIGTMSLKAGFSLYIMTSAQDILFDLFLPALNQGRFSSGLFALCRYSLRPFALGLLASGIHGRLFPFDTGDCRDYGTWLRADRGIKEEQTQINGANQRAIKDLLAVRLEEPVPYARFERQGNILYPRGSASPF